MAAPLLPEIEGLHVHRASRPVPRDGRLHVARGEVCGPLGPDGAGRTTTIFAALGLEAAEEGRVLPVARGLPLALGGLPALRLSMAEGGDDA